VSVAVTVTVPLVTVAVGVPEMAPVAGSIDMPFGRPVALHEYEPVPPLAVLVVDGYGRLTVHCGSVVGPESDIPELTFNVSDAFAVALDASVSVILTVDVPVAVGVPEIKPPLLIVNPAGSPVAVQTYGVVPLAPASVTLYAAPCTASGSDVVEIVGTSLIENENVAGVAVAPSESLRLIVAVYGPVTVGVPEMTPELGSMVTPAGRPDADHVSVPVPPTSPTVKLYGWFTVDDGRPVVVMVGVPLMTIV